MSISELKRLQEAVQTAPDAHADMVREMAAASDAAGLSDVLNRYGYAVSEDEVESLRAAPPELSDHQLEGVAGGGIQPKLTNFYYKGQR